MSKNRADRSLEQNSAMAAHRVSEHVAAVGGAHLPVEIPQTMQDDSAPAAACPSGATTLGVVEAGKRAQQVAKRVAQLAIGVDRGLQDRLADPLVLGIVGQRRPEAQDLRAALIGDAAGARCCCPATSTSSPPSRRG